MEAYFLGSTQNFEDAVINGENITFYETIEELVDCTGAAEGESVIKVEVEVVEEGELTPGAWTLE